jgi:CubicO group peptidase (beta-lactamase class C family)
MHPESPQPIDDRLFPRTLRVVHEGVKEGVFPGAAFGARIRDHGTWIGALGARRKFPESLPTLAMEAGTVFDLASLTKVMGTASLAATLVERGWISWETPVRAVIPEFPYGEIRLEHLLSHTAGYAAWAPFWQELRDLFGSKRPLEAIPVRARQQAVRERVLACAPEAPPGERALYSDISFLVLGFVLEKVVDQPLDRAIDALVWRRMGLKDTRFRRVTRSAAVSRDEQVAATELDTWRGPLLQGQVHDDNCWAMGGYGGHAGAFGPAADVLRFAGAWMQGRFVGDEVRAQAWARMGRPAGCERTRGWDTPSGESSSAGRYFSAASVGHLGFTGTSLWIDPPAGIAVTLLTNRVHPTRENNAIRAFRPRFHDAIREDIMGAWPPHPSSRI